MNIDDISRCSSLLQRIEDVNAERARAFSRLTVIFSTPDRLSGKNIVLLNSDAIHKVFDEFMAANSELQALVEVYNEIASRVGMDEFNVILRG
ncbi:TPA: hypothetical protein ACQJQ5_004909 [Escherichia coli]